MPKELYITSCGHLSTIVGPQGEVPRLEMAFQRQYWFGTSTLHAGWPKILVDIWTSVLDSSDSFTLDLIPFFGAFMNVQTQKHLFQTVTWSHHALSGRTECLVNVWIAIYQHSLRLHVCFGDIWVPFDEGPNSKSVSRALQGEKSPATADQAHSIASQDSCHVCGTSCWNPPTSPYPTFFC